MNIENSRIVIVIGKVDIYSILYTHRASNYVYLKTILFSMKYYITAKLQMMQLTENV